MGTEPALALFSFNLSIYLSITGCHCPFLGRHLRHRSVPLSPSACMPVPFHLSQPNSLSFQLSPFFRYLVFKGLIKQMP